MISIIYEIILYWDNPKKTKNEEIDFELFVEQSNRKFVNETSKEDTFNIFIYW